MGVTYSTIDRVAFDLVPEAGHLPYAFVRAIIKKHLNNARMELLKVAFADCDIQPKLKQQEEQKPIKNMGKCKIYKFTKKL